MPPLAVWLPIVSVLAVYLVRILELRARRDVISGTIRETITLRVFVLIGTAMIAGGIVEFLWKGEGLNWTTFVAGGICAIASFLIRRRAIAALGAFWSLHIEIRERHEFVRSGPFRWIRHPTYLSMLLELAAAGLMLGAPYASLIAGLLLIPALWVRLTLEESALVEKFGDAYREYQRCTPALIPYKWPSSK